MATTQGMKYLLAQPKEQGNLTELRKQSQQLKKLSGLDVVLCLENIRIYTKEKLLAEGIPFVIVGKQVYMPFMGIVLSNCESREIAPTDKISFSTQRLLLTAIYQRWTNKTLTESANILGVSKMTITRCFDEIQALGMGFIEANRKTRCFTWKDSRRDLWDAALPLLRTPVVQAYRLGEIMDVVSSKLGGMSAICHYSMLADNPFKVLAITKDTAKVLSQKLLRPIPDEETPAMIVQVMHYDMEYRDNSAIDPLSAILSISDEDYSDPRVEAAINVILEECLRD
jgi:hypothetical protein